MKANYQNLCKFLKDHMIVLATSVIHGGHYVGREIVLFKQADRFWIQIKDHSENGYSDMIPHGCSLSGYTDLEMAVEHYNDYAKE